MRIIPEAKEILKDTGSTTLTLFKIIIPISIIVKILADAGAIKIIGDYLSPAMGVVGLPGDFGFVWATTLISNIYGGLIVFFQLSLQNTYTVAQVTILGSMMLIAHTLPIEARIAQKTGVRLWYTLSLRILGAIAFGIILNIIFTTFNLYQNENLLIWKPDNTNPTLYQWVLSQLNYYLIIFLIILGLVTLMHILKKSGALDKLNNALKPLLKPMGMSKEAAPITIIGMTLGVAYGGGLIIKEAKSKALSKKDRFLSLSLMGLSHSLIEDTILILSIGASFMGIFVGRLLFTIVVMLIIVRCINRLSKKTFEKYFVSN